MTSRVRVIFELNGEAGVSAETMHAVSSPDGLFMLDNSPFYAYGISFGDIFEAQQKEGALYFQEVIRRGGHSTYRVKLQVGAAHEDFMRAWDELQRLGCSFEGTGGNSRRLYAIDVPPEADVVAVYNYLQQQEDKGIWEFEEAHYSGS